MRFDRRIVTDYHLLQIASHCDDQNVKVQVGSHVFDDLTLQNANVHFD